MQDYSKPTLEQRVFDNPPERNRYTLTEQDTSFRVVYFMIDTLHPHEKIVALYYDRRVAELCVKFMNHEIKLKKLRKVKKRK